MPRFTRSDLEFPNTQAAYAVLYCRVLFLFIFQGIAVLLMHANSGWLAARADLPIGFRLDPLHGVVHLVTGVIAAYIGFGPPSEKAAITFTQVFGIFYLLLAVFGTFTNTHFGLELAFSENSIHWTLGGISALIGFGPQMFRILRPSAAQTR